MYSPINIVIDNKEIIKNELVDIVDITIDEDEKLSFTLINKNGESLKLKYKSIYLALEDGWNL